MVKKAPSQMGLLIIQNVAMIWLYRILYLPLLILCFPYFLKRMLKRGGYGRDFKHRFGLFDKLEEKKRKRVWIQAVSVGEINAIGPLIDKLIENGVEVVLSTTTSTAYTLAQRIYSDRLKYIFIFPLDFILTSYWSWRKVDPDLCILMEGEIWPEHIQQAKNRGVSVLLINARMSDKSFKRHKKLGFLFKLFFGNISRILASNELDAGRFRELGVEDRRLIVSGNLKCDAKGPRILSGVERLDLLGELGFGAEYPVVLGASTWVGEEKLLCDIQAGLRGKGIYFNLLIVPRHAERKRELVESLPRGTRFRSDKSGCSGSMGVYVADTTGELGMFTQLADVAFIGRSLEPNDGGQSPIDGALLGVPLVYGPKMSNFKYICRSLEAEKAAMRCRNGGEVAEGIEKLLRDVDLRRMMGENGMRWAKKNQGATDITVREVINLL